MPGNTREELMISLDEFVMKKMKIPAHTLSDEDIDFVRKVRSTKKNKVNDEVIVCFSSVEARDIVQSHAKNLAEWISDDGKLTSTT